MYQYDNGTTDDVTFGEFGVEAAAQETRTNAIQSVSRFAGSLTRALLLRRARSQESDDLESPCPDAMPGTPPAETPCAKRAAELQAKAEAWRASRRR